MPRWGFLVENEYGVWKGAVKYRGPITFSTVWLDHDTVAPQRVSPAWNGPRPHTARACARRAPQTRNGGPPRREDRRYSARLFITRRLLRLLFFVSFGLLELLALAFGLVAHRCTSSGCRCGRVSPRPHGGRYLTAAAIARVPLRLPYHIHLSGERSPGPHFAPFALAALAKRGDNKLS